MSLRANKGEIKQAVQTFEDTGEVAPVLIPAYNAMVAKEQAALRKGDAPIKATEIDTAKATLMAKLPDDWNVADATADDEFVYVTVKRRRTSVAAERPSSNETHARIVKRVLQAFEFSGRDFLDRARPLTLRAVRANPRASP